MEKTQTSETKGTAASDGSANSTPPKRSPGHRSTDVRDTVAEMAAKAQEISLEAGSKMAAAMKDVISAAAGLSGFAIESARDLVQYMVRRGQMTQDEADKLIHEADDANAKRRPHPVPPPSRVPKPAPIIVTSSSGSSAPAAMSASERRPVVAKPVAKPAVAKPVVKKAAKPAAKAKPVASAKKPKKVAPPKAKAKGKKAAKR